jgi:hypothetical protein
MVERLIRFGIRFGFDCGVLGSNDLSIDQRLVVRLVFLCMFGMSFMRVPMFFIVTMTELVVVWPQT